MVRGHSGNAPLTGRGVKPAATPKKIRGLDGRRASEGPSWLQIACNEPPPPVVRADEELAAHDPLIVCKQRAHTHTSADLSHSLERMSVMR